MAIRGFNKGGGKITGVGNSGNNRAKATPKVLAKRNFITSTPSHQKVNRNVGGNAPRY